MAKQTAQEKAQEAVDVADRRVKTLTTKRDTAKAAVTKLDKEIETAQASLDYVKLHPALKSLEEAVYEAQEKVEANESDEAAQAVEGEGLSRKAETVEDQPPF